MFWFYYFFRWGDVPIWNFPLKLEFAFAVTNLLDSLGPSSTGQTAANRGGVSSTNPSNNNTSELAQTLFDEMLTVDQDQSSFTYQWQTAFGRFLFKTLIFIFLIFYLEVTHEKCRWKVWGLRQKQNIASSFHILYSQESSLMQAWLHYICTNSEVWWR